MPTRIHTALTESPDDRRRFRFERCLGRGGFGEVYLATMRSPGGVTTRVAVKLLRENVDPRAQAVRRLKDEARVLGALEHPSILSARDLVLIDERVAMLTEYVPGADLDTCLDGADPPPLRAVLEVLPGAVRFEALEWDGTRLVPSPPGNAGGDNTMGRAATGEMRVNVAASGSPDRPGQFQPVPEQGAA